MWHNGAREVSSGISEVIGHPQRSHKGPETGAKEAKQDRQIGMREELSSVLPQIRHGAGKRTDASASATPRKCALTALRARATSAA